MKTYEKIWAIVLLLTLALGLAIVTCSCRTEYYEPKKEAYTKVDGKIYGPVKSKGMLPWSTGKVLSLSVVGK